MQRDLGDEPDGVLRIDASGAGGTSTNLQRDITRQREAVRFQALDVQIRALPAADVRRACWLNLDSFSTAWVSSWPKPELHLSNAEFFEVVARYLGLGSPACELMAGTQIAGTRQTLDRYGFNLSCLSLPGDGFRDQHDCLEWQVARRKWRCVCTRRWTGFLPHAFRSVGAQDLTSNHVVSVKV
jgi:hypothetical protein